MKIGILLIIAIFFGVLFWSFGGHEITSEIPFYIQKFTVQTIKIEINGHEVEAEIARSNKEKAKGLSNRDSLGEDRGMIFVYENEGQYSFWMKEVNFPLDFIWINGDKIVDITKNVPTEAGPDYESYTSSEPADKVLEVLGGWSYVHNLEVGMTVNFSKSL